MDSPFDELLTGEDGRPVVVRQWPLTRRAVGRARRELRDVLTEWKLGELTDSAELVLSELMTNAVRHARSPRGRLVETRYERTATGVRIEVHDANPHLPRMRRAADTDEYGRGLLLVDAVTGHRWGVTSREGVGKLVWAHLG